MWQKISKSNSNVHHRKIMSLVAGLGLIGLLLVGCGAGAGGTSAAGNTATTSMPASSNNSGIGGGSTSGSTSQQPSSVPQATPAAGQKTGQYGPQYLVKTLQVTMEVSNPTQSAGDLQQWIAFNDPQSTSDGSSYQNVGNGQYTVTLTFLVDVAHYTQVEAYLRDYAAQKGRVLDSLRETVQDATNDYIDTESTLTNLRAEQQRLLAFMNQAQNLNDALNIEQQLTQVEGQINQIEAHLNELKGQTTFYTITVTVQPLGSAPPPPPQASPWSAIPVWQGAWSSVVSVGEVLVSILIWLLAYSVYIIPAGILFWLIRKRPWGARVLPQVKSAVAFAGAASGASISQPLAPVHPPASSEPLEETSWPAPAVDPPATTGLDDAGTANSLTVAPSGV